MYEVSEAETCLTIYYEPITCISNRLLRHEGICKRALQLLLLTCRFSIAYMKFRFHA